MTSLERIVASAPMLFGDIRADSLDPATVEAMRNSKAENTLKAYAGDLRRFDAWAAERGAITSPCPPEVLANYAAFLGTAGKSISTIRRAMAAVAFAHELIGQRSPTDHPVVKAALAGLSRADARQPHHDNPARGQKQALRYSDIVKLLEACDADDELRALRNRALVLFGWHSALRRSELAALTVADLLGDPDGMRIAVGPSKGNQDGTDTIGIAFADDEWECPVRTVRLWLREADITSGPVFRAIGRYGHVRDSSMAPGSIAALLKELAGRAGLDADRVAGHSLRAGNATEASANGAPLATVQKHLRHKTLQTTVGYAQHGRAVKESPSNYLGRRRHD